VIVLHIDPTTLGDNNECGFTIAVFTPANGAGIAEEKNE